MGPGPFSRDFLHPATVVDHYDYNRDRLVDGTDMAIARDNATNFITALKLIAAPAGAAPAMPASADNSEAAAKDVVFAGMAGGAPTSELPVLPAAPSVPAATSAAGTGEAQVAASSPADNFKAAAKDAVFAGMAGGAPTSKSPVLPAALAMSGASRAAAAAPTGRLGSRAAGQGDGTSDVAGDESADGRVVSTRWLATLIEWFQFETAMQDDTLLLSSDRRIAARPCEDAAGFDRSDHSIALADKHTGRFRRITRP